MIMGLDAIRVFQDMENSRFIFVISCYDEHIAHSIMQTQKPFEDIKSARKYLDRVFPFRIEIPALPNMSMINFAKNKLHSLAVYDELQKDIQKSTSYKLDNILDILIPIEANSPRVVIQILNTFLQGWWIAKQREQKCDECKGDLNVQCPDNSNCLLIKGIITEHLDLLAAISVIKILFPEFYQELAMDSRLLKAMIYSYFDVQNYKIAFNRKLTSLVLKYAMTIEKDGQKQKIQKISDKYIDLQSYLASIQNINITDDIRPFIMLLQDPLEMEIGSDALPLYEALITQNKEKLYDLLGITYNKINISDTQTTQLYNVFKQIIINEPKAHIEKACILLEPLCENFSGEQAKYLTESLIDQLLEHKYIQNLKYTDIVKMHKCKDIDEIYINKLYSYILQNVDNTMPQEPNIGKYPIFDVVALGFDLRYNNSLNNKNIKDLEKLQGLNIYNHDVLDLEDKINFYNDNIEQHGAVLLNDIGISYINSIIHYSNHVNIENDNICFENMNKILENLSSRIALSIDFAEILSAGLTNNCGNVIDFFINYINDNHLFEKINTKYITEILDAYNQRIIKGFLATDNINKNLDKYIDTFIEFLQNNKYSLDANLIAPNIEILLTKLKDADKTNKIDDILTIFQDVNKSLIDDIVNNWSKEMFISDEENDENEVLSGDLIGLIAKKYITDKEIPSLKVALKSTFEDSSLELDQINLNNYSRFISNLSNVALQNKTIIEHIQEMYSELDVALTNIDKNNSSEEYFINIFDILLPLFGKIKNENLDNLLLNIYENHLNSITDWTEYFYKKFTDYWIKEDKNNLPNYNLTEIIKSVVSICENSYKNKTSDLDLTIIYNSVYSIVKNNLLPKSLEVSEYYVSCLFDIWYFNIDFAYNNMQKFIPIIANIYNYYLLAVRNSENNPKLLKQLWEQLFKITSEKRLENFTQKFILKENFRTNVFYKTWMQLIKDKNSNIFYNALKDSFNTDIATVVKYRKKLANTISSISNDNDNSIKCGKLIFSYYIGNNDGTQKHSIALWVKDLFGIDAKEIINHNTCRKITDKEVEKLKNIFTANTYLTNKMKKIEKNRTVNI